MEDQADGSVRVRFSSNTPLPKDTKDYSLAQIMAVELEAWATPHFGIKNGVVTLGLLGEQLNKEVIIKESVNDIQTNASSDSGKS